MALRHTLVSTGTCLSYRLPGQPSLADTHPVCRLRTALLWVRADHRCSSLRIRSSEGALIRLVTLCSMSSRYLGSGRPVSNFEFVTQRARMRISNSQIAALPSPVILTFPALRQKIGPDPHARGFRARCGPSCAFSGPVARS